ncbi:TetR/AcrR family transcriptional regulator [Streptomyces wuyuanensis]|uniref:DNA-binding transcriptional regulator, AcrR family n=1 Tax=Streptomyces wuyuanensis TaxID=1196353 RepID=A0A1H0AWP3_9ACTN|nr:TetR/AcrR family transcriptional regulator [Streptomyces wuyuanensis]SDN37483.1 DNA-binding transcriptional regulator, AcrR family [Streptomyces wuyuanensis]
MNQSDRRAPDRAPETADAQPGTGGGPPRDGRTERGRRTREKIADAMLSLLDDGETQFPADRVAERAGVSRRLVFHHFADMGQLQDTAIARRLDQLAARIGPLPAEGSRETRVAALVEQRARILEWITPARLTMMRLENPTERVEFATRQVLDFARRRLAEVFAEELDRLPGERRADLLNGLDAVTTWGAWYHWRSSGLDQDAARRTMEATVHALLAVTDRAPAPDPAGRAAGDGPSSPPAGAPAPPPAR